MRTFSALGDSQTELMAGLGTRPSDTWTQQWARLAALRLGAPVQARAFGTSGNTTAQCLARADVVLNLETPDGVFLHNGVNDPPNSLSQAVTQANLQAQIKVAKHGATGPGAGLGLGCTVTAETALPATGKIGQRYVVMADGSSTGGVAPWRPGAPAKIGGTVSGSGQSVWECVYPGLTGALGWGRVAVDSTAPSVVQRIVVVSTNYLNFTTGGDTPSTPYAAYAPVRVAQQAAVTAENVAVGGVPTVIYADVYTFLRARIVAGTDPDFSSVSYDQTKSWHYTVNNQHKNVYGHVLDAQVLDAAIASAGWYATL